MHPVYHLPRDEFTPARWALRACEGQAEGSALSRTFREVEELREDLDVAIQEFLERHPQTSPRRIREAMRLAERSACSRDRRMVFGLALLAAFVVGVALGLGLG